MSVGFGWGLGKNMVSVGFGFLTSSASKPAADI